MGTKKHEFEEPWTFGQKIILLREDRHLSQEELAARSNVSVSAIQRLEQQERFTSSLAIRLIASTLRVPVEAFMDEPTAETDDGTQALDNMFRDYLQQLIYEGKQARYPKDFFSIAISIYLVTKAREDNANLTRPGTLKYHN